MNFTLHHCKSFLFFTFLYAVLVPSLSAQSSTPTPSQQPGSKDAVMPEVVVSGSKEKRSTQTPQDGSAASGYQVKTVSVGVLGKTALQDTPYSISVTPSSFIENIQASNPTDALKFSPAVNPEMGSNRTGDYLAIRGFINSSNQALDGMRQDLSSGTYLENKERIEILSGANSFLYGIASPAGMVNYILKRPTSEQMHKITLGDYGGGQAYLHVDAGGPLDKAKIFGYRTNLLGVSDGSTGVDQESNRRMLFSGALDWHLGAKSLLAFDSAYFHRALESSQAFFKVGHATAVPKAPDASRNYAAPYAGFESSYATYGATLATAIGSASSLRAAFRYSKSLANDRSLREVWTDNNGNYKEEMLYYPGQNKEETFQGNAFIDASVQTGFAFHKLSAGYVVDHIPSTSTSDQGTQFYEGTTVFNMEHPAFEPFPAITITKNGPYIPVESSTRQSAVFADQIDLSHKMYALAGVAYAKVKDVNYPASTGDGTTTRYEKGAYTPSLALMYKPMASVTTYVSYIEALAQGPIASESAKNANQILPPYESSQIEVGIKTQIHRTSVNAALFRIRQANAYTNPTTEIYSEDGREVHKGAELSWTGKLTNSLTLLGGASYLDASITKTSTASLQGKSPQAVPHTMLRLYADYAIPGIRGLAVSAGIYYTGKEWVNNSNTIAIPRILPGDIGARYQHRLCGKDLVLRANVNNITNENYWTTKGGSMLYLGSPRIVATSVNLQF